MKTNLFLGCKTSDEVDQRYQELSRVFTCQDEMLKAIKAEYSVLMETLKIAKPVDATKKKVTMNDMIDALHGKVKSDAVNVEVIKDWLLVSGKTFDVRDALKELGFRYSSDKKSWYWRADEKKITIAHEPLPFDLIREKYGSKEVILL